MTINSNCTGNTAKNKYTINIIFCIPHSLKICKTASSYILHKFMMSTFEICKYLPSGKQEKGETAKNSHRVRIFGDDVI